MGKYETNFKLKVVESFLAGEGGAKLLARRWSVPEEKIRTWVSHYRLHGIAALRPKRGAYTADFKLQVLTHQDRERLSSRQVAAIYDIRNPNQVVVWRRAFDGGGVAALEGRRPAHPMKADKPNPEPPDTDGTSSNRALREEVERLRAEVAYLRTVCKTQIAVGLSSAIHAQDHDSRTTANSRAISTLINPVGAPFAAFSALARALIPEPPSAADAPSKGCTTQTAS